MSLSKLNISTETLIELLRYFDRDQLDKLSTMSNFFHRTVKKHFPEKPYRLLKRNPGNLDIQLFAEIHDNDGIRFEIVAMNDDSRSWYNVKTKSWVNTKTETRRMFFYTAQDILSFLTKLVRVASATIYVF